MKLAFAVNLVLASQLAHAEVQKCPQIDPAKKFPDGIPYCPAEIQTDSAWAVMGCAFSQAKQWHPATEPEKVDMRNLIRGLLANKPAEILSRADVLRLQVCRSQALEKENVLDSFLVFYTKPGVKDYSGPFLMFREGGKTSDLIIHSPHDGTDSAHASTKRAFQNSNALALISNGHHKTLSLKLTGDKTRSSDWAHSRADLGYTAFQALKNQVPKSVHFHVHGCRAREIMVTDSATWKDAKHEMRNAFMDVAKKLITSIGGDGTFKVVPWNFGGWTPGYDLTRSEDLKSRKDNGRFIGVEVYVGLHSRPLFLSKLTNLFETEILKQPRGWKDVQPAPAPAK